MSEYSYDFFSIPEKLETLVHLDDLSIEESMKLDSKELFILSRSKGFSILVKKEDLIVGSAYALPSLEVRNILLEVDPEFICSEGNIYFYSIVVHPYFRQKGLGTELLSRLIKESKQRGFKKGTIHARKVFNWSTVVSRICNPYETRVIKGFWPEMNDSDVEFQSFNLN